MKYIVRVSNVNPEKKLIIDGYNPEIKMFGLDEFLRNYLPYTTIYKIVEIRNFYTVPAVLLERLTNQYLHGTEISFETVKLGFKQSYICPKPRKFCRYDWVPFTLTQPIPKSLAEYRFTYNGKETTYLDAVKSLSSTYYIPHDIWNALDEYSRERITACRKYNEGFYPYAEDWFKQLWKDAHACGVQVMSPNKKTYFEALAELDFESLMQDQYTLKAGLRPLNEEELIYLHKYAPAYGVEIPQLVTRINTHKTKHGYTQEPEVILAPLSEGDYNRALRDDRAKEKGLQLPWHVRRGLLPQVRENDKLLRDAYFTLRWIMKHASELPNNGLIDGYARCPHCHKIYHETEGCECGAVLPIEFVNTPNLFYSDAASYELHGIKPFDLD